MKNDGTNSARWWSLSSLLAIMTLGAAPVLGADANPPGKMTYQGYLVDAAGNKLGDPNPKNYDVVFRIFDEQNGGNTLWAEQQTVTVDKGYFSVLLGEGSDVPGDLHPVLTTVFTGPSASERYIGITVKLSAESSVTISPRLKFVTSPFAFLAKNATALVNDSGQAVLTANATSVQVNGSISAANLTGFGTIPIGGIIMWSGATIPTGWALCDGGKSNGQQTPDLRGRFVLASGAGAGLTARTLGQKAGEETHLLTIPEMPAHTHDWIHGWEQDDSGYGGSANEFTWVGGSFTGDQVMKSTGGNLPHNTMPPYYVLAFIMRVQ
jgi:microcystin-dependent protein